MKKRMLVFVMALSIFSNYSCSDSSQRIPSDRTKKIEGFLKKVVAETLKADYLSHNMDIEVVVTNMKIDKIHKAEGDMFISYLAQGEVSYMIRGKRIWRDKEGNIIRLDPEEEITHWFNCGILEDRYGDLLKDRRNRLTFYADKPNL